MRGFQKVLPEGVHFFFEGREDPNTAITTISSTVMAFLWLADDGPTLNSGLVAL